MRGKSILLAGTVGVLLSVVATARAADDAQVAFEHREDTMKRMGRAFYTTRPIVV